MQTKVYSILQHKGHDVLTTTPSTSVFDAIERMVEANVGSILVMENEEVVGIFTERDYLRRIVLKGRTSRNTAIREVMTDDIITVTPHYTVEDCLAIMTDQKCRHLPVIEEGGELVGIVSIGDCVKQISAAAQKRVKDLTAYIKGNYPG